MTILPTQEPEADPLPFLQSHGFQVEAVPVDGRIHRVAHNCSPSKAKAGYFLLWSKPFGHGFIGCWRCGLKLQWAGVARDPTPEEKAAMEEAEKRSAKEQREIERAVAEGVEEAVRELPFASPDHPYLVAKRIKPCGARYQERGNMLVIPLRDVQGKIWSAQGIAAEPLKELGGRTKTFERGGRVRGCFAHIGPNMAEAPQILVCEGFATAATLHEATGFPVAAAMSAGNLGAVCKALRNVYPRTAITVCSDSDRHTKGNPGEEAADVASLAIGAACAVPDFKGFPDDKDHTDFNDLARVVGIDRVREIVMAAVPPARPILIYNSGTGKWWSLNGVEFVQIDQGAVVRRLHISGISRFSKDGAPSPMDYELDRLMHDDSVRYAGPIAGWPRGVHVMSEKRVLVTAGCHLPMPGPGGCPTILSILENMFGRSQTLRFIFWLQVGRRRLFTRIWHPHVAIMFIGPKNAGKSMIQSGIIPRAFGGRTGKPCQYMQGITPFNGDLIGAEHLAFEDETQRRDSAARRHFGESIKSMLFCRDIQCHPKFGQPAVLNPYWSLSVSVNDDPEHLQVLPQIDDSLSDKILLLRCIRAPRPVPDGVNETKWLTAVLDREMPAFLGLVDALSLEAYPEFHDSRTILAGWQNPDLTGIIQGLSVELQFLSLIDDILFDGTVIPSTWTGTAEQLSRTLRDSKFSREVEKILSWPTACGTYLGRISKMRPDRVQNERQKRTGAQVLRHWTIAPPGEGF